jgi:hypothetical protein
MPDHNHYVITNASGEIVAVGAEAQSGMYRSTIMPGPKQKMYSVHIPRDIHSMTDPTEFHKAITNHFRSDSSKVHITDLDAHVKSLIKKHAPKK